MFHGTRVYRVLGVRHGVLGVLHGVLRVLYRVLVVLHGVLGVVLGSGFGVGGCIFQCGYQQVTNTHSVTGTHGYRFLPCVLSGVEQ